MSKRHGKVGVGGQRSGRGPNSPDCPDQCQYSLPVAPTSGEREMRVQYCVGLGAGHGRAGGAGGEAMKASYHCDRRRNPDKGNLPGMGWTVKSAVYRLGTPYFLKGRKGTTRTCSTDWTTRSSAAGVAVLCCVRIHRSPLAQKQRGRLGQGIPTPPDPKRNRGLTLSDLEGSALSPCKWRSLRRPVDLGNHAANTPQGERRPLECQAM